MKDPITPFGKRWEIRHSLWLIWLFGPFALTAFISFFYISYRTGKRKWWIAAIIYLILPLVTLYTLGSIEQEEGLIVDLLAGTAISIWIFAFVHGFLARKEYLRIIAKKVIDHPFHPTPPVVVQTIYPFFEEKELRGNLNSIKKKKAGLPVADNQEPFMLNINEADVKEIASHPYIGNIVARQIVEVRNKVDKFQSYTHFTQTTNIKPHILVKAKPYLIFDNGDVDQPNEEQKPRKETRKNDSYRSGRIVDL